MDKIIWYSILRQKMASSVFYPRYMLMMYTCICRNITSMQRFVLSSMNQRITIWFMIVSSCIELWNWMELVNVKASSCIMSMQRMIEMSFGACMLTHSIIDFITTKIGNTKMLISMTDEDPSFRFYASYAFSLRSLRPRKKENSKMYVSTLIIVAAKITFSLIFCWLSMQFSCSIPRLIYLKF